MQNDSTPVTLTDDADPHSLKHHHALAEIDYLNLFMEQRVTEYVRRNEKAVSDMLRSLDRPGASAA
ncbi:hypothetical protein OVY01_00740 [Robbsia sp. Bb-Pol-6]|uniref:Uncharacterized protein n=1 Tax=Robbsia betulipollinis TaxID=2981849 RepID=A0ABT3ZGZ2_9BURK|nr:hypothetical protein [Robbsia betulipollinis]MCY0385789.1 hypothetical protein [Robbsia betulipollinis]